MKRGLGLLICLVVLLCLGIGSAEREERAVRLQALSVRLLDHIRAGEEAEALQMMDGTMQAAMKGKIQALWDQLLQTGGQFEKTGAWQMIHDSGYTILEMTLEFSKGKLVQRTVFDDWDKVAGLFVVPGEVPDKEASAQTEPLPQGLTEKTVTVDAGSGFPLEGSLTLPEGEILCGLVLVHGSGPSDRNETVMMNAPFRDLAWGLARRGIAVLRYDKRTFVYSAQLAASPDIRKMTVNEETVQDAAAAVQLMKELPELAGKKVFLLGHSLGGVLTAYINTLGAGAEGYINLAGTPRKLWRVAADQNLLVADEKTGEEAEKVRDYIIKELEKAAKLASLSDYWAQSSSSDVFGISAWYWRHLEQLNPAALHLADGLPVLILQGEEDRQVTLKDYEAWQEGLKGHPDATFILYPGLNHLFGRYQGEQVPFEQIGLEYSQRTPVPDEVLDDMAGWLEDKCK